MKKEVGVIIYVCVGWDVLQTCTATPSLQEQLKLYADVSI
jgi:hypothetical protein